MLGYFAEATSSDYQISQTWHQRWLAILEKAEMGEQAGGNNGTEIQDNGALLYHEPLHEYHREVRTLLFVFPASLSILGLLTP